MKYAILSAVALVAFGGAVSQAPAQTTDQIIAETGIDLGLAAVLGGDAETPASLAAEGRMIVHWLVADATRVDGVRVEIARRGLGGRVVLGTLSDDGRLPQPDRLVNLLVGDLDALGDRAPATAEIDRVLAVRGASYVQSRGQWRVRPSLRNEKLDGWTHRFYDASGNCVGRDRLVGFPRAVQWQHGPAMEDGCGNGKIPRIADGRHVAVDTFTGDLVCRDAGNGTLLWRVPVAQSENADFAVVDGRIYLYFDAEADDEERRRYRTGHGPLVALDLATGKTVQVYDESLRGGTADVIEFRDGDRDRRERPVPWFVVERDVIVQAYGPDLVVLDRASGRRRWQRTLDGATWFSPVVLGDVLLAAEAATPARRGRHDGTGEVRAVSAFALADGKPRWRNDRAHPLREVEEKGRRFRARAEFKPMSAADGLVLLHVSSYQFRQGGSVAVLDARDGRELWRREFMPKELYTQGSQRAVLRAGEVVILDGLGAFRFDAKTGRPVGEPLRPPRFERRARSNGACAASRATVDWLVCNAYLYVGPDGEPRTFFGARGQCGEGVVPAHGLVFVPPASCDCGDYTRGYQALAPSVPGKPIADEARLVRLSPKGSDPLSQGGLPPFREMPEAGELGPAWPVFLGDPMRQSCTDAALPGQLTEQWRVRAASTRADEVDADRRHSERYLGALSAPVVGGGLVVMAAPEQHQVLAFEAESGKPRWSYAAGGKVDSPPTLARGLAVFGCDDGSVTALRLADGRPAWRFLAAPTDGVAMHHGHLASAFPVPGSVLVLGDAVVAVAGHHTDLGGLHCWVLDLATGTPRARRVIRADQPAVAANGITVADAGGQGFWIGRQLHLSLALEDLPADEAEPPVWFDRSGSRMRFRTNDRRGGSTHGWKGAMRAGWAGAHRVVRHGPIVYAMRDPTQGDRHPVRADETALVTAGSGTWRDKKIQWTASVGALGSRPSYGAMIKAAEHLYLGGGQRDGTSGFLQVLDAGSGKLLATHELPSRVTECGLAAAGGRLVVACEDGNLICLGD
jgi:outer membrane protein assembly factor BamB